MMTSSLSHQFVFGSKRKYHRLDFEDPLAGSKFDEDDEITLLA